MSGHIIKDQDSSTIIILFRSWFLKYLKMNGGSNMRKRYAVALMLALILRNIMFAETVKADTTSTISFTVTSGGLSLTSTPELNFVSTGEKGTGGVLSFGKRSSTFKTASISDKKLVIEDYRGNEATPWTICAQLSSKNAGVIHSEVKFYTTSSGKDVKEKLTISNEPAEVMHESAKSGKTTTKLTSSRLDPGKKELSAKKQIGTVTWMLINTAAN